MSILPSFPYKRNPLCFLAFGISKVQTYWTGSGDIKISAIFLEDNWRASPIRLQLSVFLSVFFFFIVLDESSIYSVGDWTTPTPSHSCLPAEGMISKWEGHSSVDWSLVLVNSAKAVASYEHDFTLLSWSWLGLRSLSGNGFEGVSIESTTLSRSQKV